MLFRSVVIGPFASSTNAMCEYLNQLFDVEVHPPLTPKTRTGFTGRAGGSVGSDVPGSFTWKHTPPLKVDAGEYSFGEDTLVIQMIREPCSWLHAVARSKYTLMSSIGLDRKDYVWLQNRVTLDAPGNHPIRPSDHSMARNQIGRAHV